MSLSIQHANAYLHIIAVSPFFYLGFLEKEPKPITKSLLELLVISDINKD